jgi:hypothetical protein
VVGKKSIVSAASRISSLRVSVFSFHPFPGKFRIGCILVLVFIMGGRRRRSSSSG